MNRYNFYIAFPVKNDISNNVNINEYKYGNKTIKYFATHIDCFGYEFARIRYTSYLENVICFKIITIKIRR